MNYQSTEEEIRGSIGFVRLCEAMDRAFPGRWEIESIHHDGSGFDFSMWVAIDHHSHAAYLGVARTHPHGSAQPTSRGVVGLEVPTPDLREYLSFDRVWITAVEQFFPGGKETYRFGVDPDNTTKLDGYIALLRQYLEDQQTGQNPGVDQ